MRYIRTHHLSETSKINSARSGRERKREIDTSSLSSCSFWETLTYKYCSSRGLDHLLSPHSKPSPQIPAETCISMSAASSQQSLMVHMLLTPISWIHLPTQWEATFREISSLNPLNTHLSHILMIRMTSGTLILAKKETDMESVFMCSLFIWIAVQHLGKCLYKNVDEIFRKFDL